MNYIEEITNRLRQAKPTGQLIVCGRSGITVATLAGVIEPSCADRPVVVRKPKEQSSYHDGHNNVWVLGPSRPVTFIDDLVDSGKTLWRCALVAAEFRAPLRRVVLLGGWKGLGFTIEHNSEHKFAPLFRYIPTLRSVWWGGEEYAAPNTHQRVDVPRGGPNLNDWDRPPWLR